jgi:hypothetical protein
MRVRRSVGGTRQARRGRRGSLVRERRHADLKVGLKSDGEVSHEPLKPLGGACLAPTVLVGVVGVVGVVVDARGHQR